MRNDELVLSQFPKIYIGNFSYHKSPVFSPRFFSNVDHKYRTETKHGTEISQNRETRVCCMHSVCPQSIFQWYSQANIGQYSFYFSKSYIHCKKCICIITFTLSGLWWPCLIGWEWLQCLRSSKWFAWHH